MNKTIIRAIEAVLADWAELDDAHKGKDYGKAVESLKKWIEELEASK